MRIGLNFAALGALLFGIVGVLLRSDVIFGDQLLLGGRGKQVMTIMGSVCMVSAPLGNRRQCRCYRTPDLDHFLEIETVTFVTLELRATGGGVS